VERIGDDTGTGADAQADGDEILAFHRAGHDRDV
jgi:hypothetical protein